MVTLPSAQNFEFILLASGNIVFCNHFYRYFRSFRTAADLKCLIEISIGKLIYSPAGLFKNRSDTVVSVNVSNFLSLLDDLADNYPSIQLQNFSITTRSFAAADGTSSSGSIYNVTLRVVLCDKGGVQP